MKKVLTFGVYDLTHIGHVKLFEKAKSFGDYLIVAVQDGKYVKINKPTAHEIYTTEERCYMVNALKAVDKVITYKTVDEDIQHIDFDVFIIGEDQNHIGFQKAVEWCKRNNKEVHTLPRTKGISTSELVIRIKDIFF